MVSAALMALVDLIQIPLTVLASLNLGGSLYPTEKTVANNSCFDYIIIGGGTAGCPLAARLSEDPNHSVLLLESGGNPPLSSFLPALFPFFAGSKFDRNYSSTEDNYAASSQNGHTKLSAGNVLGGSSSISHLLYSRGSAADYDNWAKIVDDLSWSYENVLPYFKKTEDIVDAEIRNSNYSTVHGLDGPNAITRQAKAYAEKYTEALNETGKSTPLDTTGNVSMGFAQSIFTLNNKGIRQNTGYTYLTPIRLRKNLYVLRYTNAIRIIFERKRAVAVVAVRKGKVYVYRASKEIILSAGVFNSPKLLMLSGVGPRKPLESLNIPVVADLPVGQNFQDQVSVSLVHKMEQYLLVPPLYTFVPTNVSFPVITGLAALNSSQPYADYQTFMLLFFANTPFLPIACATVFQFRADLCDQFSKANLFHNSLYTLLGITQPHSRGTVELKSADPSDDPVITTGYLKNQTDLENMVDYIIDFLKIENSTYFKEVSAELIDPKLEQCNNFTFRSREYWSCYVLNTAGSVYHNCGTCSMASVTDSRLRVFNVTNLRVVDASIMPVLTNGSPYIDVLMIAEKAADMIKEDAGKESSCSEIYGIIEEDISSNDDSNTVEPRETTDVPSIKYKCQNIYGNKN